MIYQPLVLRAAAAVTSGGTVFESVFTKWVTPRVFVVTLAGAAVLSLAALMQAAVGGRIDRAYLAMFRAFSQQREIQTPSRGRHRSLTVVREKDRAAP